MIKHQELARQSARLDQLFLRAGASGVSDPELLAHWGRYLCILVSGFLENALAELYGGYCTSSASPAVANYATANLRRLMNPNPERFVDTARQFRKDWSEALEEFMDQNERASAIRSIMTNRHKIAHGKDSDITIARAREYYKRSLEVVEFIESQVSTAVASNALFGGPTSR